MRVATYARVSSESQEARGTIGSQLEALRRKMSELGHEVVREYTDDGYSGARLDRPGLDALRDAAEAGLFEQVWAQAVSSAKARLRRSDRLQVDPSNGRATFLATSVAAEGVGGEAMEVLSGHVVDAAGDGVETGERSGWARTSIASMTAYIVSNICSI